MGGEETNCSYPMCGVKTSPALVCDRGLAHVVPSFSKFLSIPRHGIKKRSSLYSLWCVTQTLAAGEIAQEKDMPLNSSY